MDQHSRNRKKPTTATTYFSGLHTIFEERQEGAGSDDEEL
jgi:hypothetical protein